MPTMPDTYTTIAEYCRAVDRLDWTAVRSVYTADGIDHHTGFDGGADEFVAWIRLKLPGFSGTMHLIGNHLAEFIDDATALCETYGTATHWGEPSGDPAHNFTSGFRYVDHMRCESGRWLIAERFAVREWTRSEAGRLMQPEGPGPRGRRDEHDPLARLRAAMLTR